MAENWFDSRILYAGKYTIPEESPEIVDGWTREVQKVWEVISSGNMTPAQLAETLMPDNATPDKQGKIMHLAEKACRKIESLPDEMSKKVFTTALWTMAHKGTYGYVREPLKVLIGGKYPLSEKLAKGGFNNCAESSTLARVLAKQAFGIEGEIHTMGMDTAIKNIDTGYGHQFYQTTTGQIVDAYWSKSDCGYAQDITEMLERGKAAEESSCHLPFSKKTK